MYRKRRMKVFWTDDRSGFSAKTARVRPRTFEASLYYTYYLASSKGFKN
jgi:hypothetical protein